MFNNHLNSNKRITHNFSYNVKQYLKHLFKRYFPSAFYMLKRVYMWHLRKKKITNYFKTDYKKNALLSYITHPFTKELSFEHTNYFEAMSIARALRELGYNVDIINFYYSGTVDFSKYNVLIGFGDVFQQYFESKFNHLKTIYYATGMHVCHQNTISLKRVKDVYQKKGVWLGKSARFVEKTWTHQTTLVDAIIALGNEICANSYRKYYDGSIYSLPVPFYEIQDAKQIIENRSDLSKKHYLWFGSSGMIHKGLDLCLDYFSKNQHVFLHICGPVQQEIEFVNAYRSELFHSPNIKIHGFVDISSKEFKDIVSKCSFVIFPSCSECGAASVLAAIGNGGLIPIITKETTVETGYEIWIEDFNYESIEKAINYSQSLTFSQIKELQLKNLEYVKKNHNHEVYYNKLRAYIKEILEVENAL